MLTCEFVTHDAGAVGSSSGPSVHDKGRHFPYLSLRSRERSPERLSSGPVVDGMYGDEGSVRRLIEGG